MFSTSFDQHVAIAKHIEKLSELIVISKLLLDPNHISGWINGAEISFFTDLDTENSYLRIGIFYQVLSHLIGQNSVDILTWRIMPQNNRDFQNSLLFLLVQK